MGDELELELIDLVHAKMLEHQVPGVAVGVVTPDLDGIVTAGVASIERPEPIGAETGFEIASITKTVTASVIARMTDVGELSLDVPVRTYLPDLQLADAEVAARVTLRHLLTHTAGWVGDDLGEFGCDDGALARHVAALHDLVQVTPLGTTFSYNNSGFCLAGRVAEAASGRSFEAVTYDFLQAVGLRTAAFASEEAGPGPAAEGHFLTPDGQVITAERSGCGRAHNPNGGLVMSVRDLLAYARFHLGGGLDSSGQELLRPATLGAMHTPQGPGPGSERTGFAWSILDVDGVRISSHGGDGTGQQSLLTIVRDAGLAVATLTNSNRGRLVAGAVAEWALKRYVGVSMPRPIRDPRPGSRLDEFSGRWVLPGKTVELRRDGDVLRVTYASAVRPGKNNPPLPEMSATLTTTGGLLLLDGPFAGTVADLLDDGPRQPRRVRFLGRVYVAEADAHFAH